MNCSKVSRLAQCFIVLLVASCGIVLVQSFSILGPSAVAKPTTTLLFSTTAATPIDGATSTSAANGDKELLKRDRYVATNRKYYLYVPHLSKMLSMSSSFLPSPLLLQGFTVRPGSSAKFEKRWADRSSRLASLEGFKYFHLMRRVGVDGDENSGE